MTRFEDWPMRLAAFIDGAERGAFKWGARDCGLFAADAVLAITGIDVASEYRGAYATEKEASAIVGDLPTFAQQITEQFGMLPIDPKFAQRGDVVLLGNKNLPAFGVCVGRYIAAPGKRRLMMVPRAEATHAWRVG